MSNDSWVWARKAHELKFHQLETARKQAESWRNGLASVTLLYGVVLTVKGRGEFTSIPNPWPLVIATLLAVALILLAFATFSAIRASSGSPGDECLLTGEDLELWTRNEVATVYSKIKAARYATLGGIFVIGVAVLLTWFAPTKRTVAMNLIYHRNGVTCGEIVTVNSGRAVVRRNDDVSQMIYVASIISIYPVERCP